MTKPRACGCNDFSRTELARRAVAEAGQGLPPIEPGMPLPAGTGLSRRSFVSRAAGLALAVYGGTKLLSQAYDDGIAQAAAAPAEPVLVSIFLDGGADALSILFPDGDPRYRVLRPRLALPASSGIAFAEDPRLRWHPSLASLATLHGEGKVTVMPAVGYTSPDQSHFTSRHYWEVGATDPLLRTGWLGRYLDKVGAKDNPLQGLSLFTRLQPSLATARVPVASIEGPDRYSLTSQRVDGAVAEQMVRTLAPLGSAHEKSKDAALKTAGQITSQSYRLRTQLLPFAPTNGQTTFGSSVTYPTSNDQFPRRLAGLAAMLAMGLPLRCVTLEAPGMYDTHAQQADDLSDALKLTADTLLAFQRDLEARGLADRVLVHLWTEFGRRAKENASLGTDHGAAGSGFLIGTRASGKMVGEFPGLASGLDEKGNLRATSDFRGVYAGLLEQWLSTDAAAVIPNAASFQRPTLVR
ncbi:MAG: DUF1501 domain-containing protein [Actinobacteria bacterium]|nr:DUF1501 domain-containing protein [Actinomycetota bacterium]